MNCSGAVSDKRNLVVGLTALLAGACVDHRPIRNGLSDEYIYLTKANLTQVNPKTSDPADDGWLMKVTVVGTSVPGDMSKQRLYPGAESDISYVRFRFTDDSLQVVDTRSLQRDDAEDPNDDLPAQADAILMEFDGKHVDVKLRESLDGERTNLEEENTEAPWQKRQTFRVDLGESDMSPATSISWTFGPLLKNCTEQVSAHLVPGSFEWDETDQYLSWVTEVVYSLSARGTCPTLTGFLHGSSTATVQFRFSFYRPGVSNYAGEEIAEKDPVNKKYGSFQLFSLFRDEETGLLGARRLIQRWNPEREEPVTYYFAEGFPDRFKPMFEKIAADTNRIMEEAGAKLRFQFLEHDHDGKVRNVGDVRHSFVIWHQALDANAPGLLGLGPPGSDPRTGEIISSQLNLYNIGFDRYRFVIQSYLEDHGAEGKPEGNQPWEQIACNPGETLAPQATPEQGSFLKTRLFDEMREILHSPDTGHASDFVPTPTRGQEFYDDYHRLLPELRYTFAGASYYARGEGRAALLEEYGERLAAEKEFQEAMGRISMNENPFEASILDASAMIDEQLAFAARLRAWMENHERLARLEDQINATANVHTMADGDALQILARSARRCVNGRWESDAEYRERIIEGVVRQVAIHELGHNLSLRHNFYGSVDAKHMRPGDLSASVMDYVPAQFEAASELAWGAYDEAALKWIYGGERVRREVMKKDLLYCTDEHRGNSPLCTAHDLGITPSQIVLNAIEDYDWNYKYRNFRVYKQIWDTSSYASGAYSSLFGPLRMWRLGVFDWGGGGVEETLKRLDQVDPDRPALDAQAYRDKAQDFYNEISAATNIAMAFYNAVLKQSAVHRNFQTEFDPYYGDVLRMGIIADKLFATMAFMDMHRVDDYNPNVETYASLYEYAVSDQSLEVAHRVLGDMIGANYETFPWFRYMALTVFAGAANSNLISDASLKDWIAIQRFPSLADFEEVYGPGAREVALRPDNAQQTFEHNGESYVYTYLPERNWHLVAGMSRNRHSYKTLVEYNEALRANTSRTMDSYALKLLVALHERFNNFSGY
jgi:hypothetical protein